MPMRGIGGDDLPQENTLKRPGIKRTFLIMSFHNYSILPHKGRVFMGTFSTHK